ncbi:MAG: hypothetical protein ACRCXM_16285 [Beijerinckiaceae bacterium]
MRHHFVALAGAALLALSVTPVSAAPIGAVAAPSLTEAAPALTEQVQVYRYRGRYYRGGYYRGYRGGDVAAGVAAGALGALALGAIAAEASRPRPPVVNYEPACMRARSYDPASQTFVDRRGRLRPCSY